MVPIIGTSAGRNDPRSPAGSANDLGLEDQIADVGSEVFIPHDLAMTPEPRTLGRHELLLESR